MFYKLQLIIDVPFCNDTTQFALLPDLIEAGVTSIQLREKFAPLEEIAECAIKLVKLLRPLNIPLIINDYVELVEKTGADGVHIGQKDCDYTIARNLLGPHKIIGLSIENAQQAKEAKNIDVNYFGVGPVFETSTKKDAAPCIGLGGLNEIASILYSRPIIAIGGIKPQHLADLLQHGAQGAAVISAIVKAPKPIEAVNQFFNIRQRHDSHNTLYCRL